MSQPPPEDRDQLEDLQWYADHNVRPGPEHMREWARAWEHERREARAVKDGYERAEDDLNDKSRALAALRALAADVDRIAGEMREAYHGEGRSRDRYHAWAARLSSEER